MRVYRSSYRDRQGRKRQTARWYIEFRDHRRRVRRVPALTDKRQSAAIGRRIENLVSRKGAGELPDTEALAWLQTACPAKIRAALGRFGIIGAGLVSGARPLTDHVEGQTDDDGHVTFAGFRQALTARGRTAAHVNLTCGRIDRIVKGCGFIYFADITGSAVVSFLHELRRSGKGRGGTTGGGVSDRTANFHESRRGGKGRGISARTANFYLSAFKSFCRWAVRDGRLSVNPVEYLQPLDADKVKADARHERRALSVDELRWLLDTTAGGPARVGISGRDRSMLYRLAAETGLRANELRSLTRGSFDLDGGPATVRVEAAYSKHRRDDVLPLRRDTARALKEFFSLKLPDAPAFAMPSRYNVAGMLGADLAAAREAWLADTSTDQEREEREKTSFLRYRDAAGRFADFHSLRHTAATLLASSGVHPAVAQSLLRHSDIRLTMHSYTHVAGTAEVAALESLPDLGAAPVKRTDRATGT